MSWTRRSFIRAFLGGIGAFIAGTTYAIGYGPMQRPDVTRYRIKPTKWPDGMKLKIAALADIHACEPWMSAQRIAGIVRQTNALNADIIVLLGDYVAGLKHWRIAQVPPEQWARELGKLSAPLGIHAIQGNHDWWDDRQAQETGRGPTMAQRALEEAGIPVYENRAARLELNGKGFWLAGLADQLAVHRGGRWSGLDDLPTTLQHVTTDEPIILLAHEPDIFPNVPQRVALTLSGHTHGGQVRFFRHSPVVPSRYGNRYAYGHVTDHESHLIVSGGLGCSIAPIRIGVPPEIVLVEIG